MSGSPANATKLPLLYLEPEDDIRSVAFVLSVHRCAPQHCYSKQRVTSDFQAAAAAADPRVCTVRPATVGVPRLRLLRSYRAARSVACFFSSVSTFRMYACRRGPSKDPSGRCSRTSVGAADAPARHLSQRIAFELFNVELQLFDVIGQDRHFLALIAQLVRCNTPLARCQKYTRPTRSGLCSPSRSETDRRCARAWLGASSTLACRGIATIR